MEFDFSVCYIQHVVPEHFARKCGEALRHHGFSLPGVRAVYGNVVTVNLVELCIAFTTS
jgi:hypothetical protein